MQVGHKWKQWPPGLERLVSDTAIQLQEFEAVTRDLLGLWPRDPNSFFVNLGKELIHLYGSQKTNVKQSASYVWLPSTTKLNDEAE